MTLPSPARRPPSDDGPLAPLAAAPGVAEAVEEARAAVDRLLGHRVVRRRSVEVTAESSLRGARASADLDGAPLRLDDLRDALKAGGPVPGDDAVRQRVDGAVRLHAGMGALAATADRAPRQAWAKLHVLAARDVVADEDLGRPRTGPDAEDPLDLGPAPAPAEVASRLDTLVDVLARSRRTPALVQYAVVHGELLVLRPFRVASGVVARGAGRLVLVQRGLDPKALSVPEVGHAEMRDEYAAAARAYLRGEPGAAVAWVQHCARAVALGAREGIAVCEAVQRGAATG